MTTQRVQVVVSALERFIEGIIKKVTLDVVANLLRPGREGGTPVDTGWARSNWIPALTSVSSTASAPQPGGANKAATREAVPGQLGIQQSAVGAIATGYRLKQGSVTISNNVPYLKELNNDGSSSQAPKGFVQAAIRRAVTVDLPAGFSV